MIHIKTFIAVFVVINTSVINSSSLYDESNDFKHILDKKLFRAKSEISKIVTKFDDVVYRRLKRDSGSNIVTYNGILDNETEINKPVLIFPEGKTSNINGRMPLSFRILTEESFSFSLGDATFLQAYEWQNNTLVIAGMKNGFCYLYTSSSPLTDTFKKLQTIDPPSKGDYPVGGKFFEEDDQLFLYLIYDESNHGQVSSILYKLRNSYLDKEFHNILTSRATTIDTFDSGTSTIIIIGQTVDDHSKVGTQVLRFSKRNEKLERIQVLDTKVPTTIMHFRAYNDHYIFVCEESSPSYIYWWIGGEFIEWLKIPYIHGDCKFTIHKVQDTTLLFYYKDNEITIYAIGWKKLEDVAKIPYTYDDNGNVEFKLQVEKHNQLYAITKNSTHLRTTIWNLILPPQTDEEEDESTHPVDECLNKISIDIGDLKEKTNSTKRTFSNLLYIDKSIIYPGRIEVLGDNNSVKVKLGQTSYIKRAVNDVTILEELNEIMNITNDILQSTMNRYSDVHIIFNSNLYIKKAVLDSVSSSKVNGIILEKSKFISLSEKQLLNNVTAKNIKTNILLADQLGTKKTDDLLLKSSFGMKEKLLIGNLTCKNIVFKNKPLINKINVRDIVSKKNKEVLIRGKKIFKRLHADDMSIININKVFFRSWLQQKLAEFNSQLTQQKLNDNVIIENLDVEKINDIDVNSLFSSVVKNENPVIQGDVMFLEKVIIRKLINLKKPHISEYVGKRVSRELHSSTGGNYMNSITEDITDDEQRRFLEKKSRTTDKRSYSNIRYLYKYKGDVKINGSLQANEIICRNCTVIVNNTSVPLSELNVLYWTRNTEQTISVPLRITSSVTILGNLTTSFINGIPTDSILHTTSDKEYNSFMTFENITIDGDISDNSNKNHNGFNARKLDESIVKNFGTQQVTGHKNFSGGLSVNYINFNNLTEIHSETDSRFRSLGKKASRFIIHGNLIVKGDLVVEDINNLSLNTKIKSAAYVNEVNTFTKIGFKNVSAHNINTTVINGLQFHELMYNGDRKKKFRKVRIDGSIAPLELLDVQYVDGRNISDFLPKVVDEAETSVIEGVKTFTTQVIVTNNLITETINNIDLHDMFTNTLLKSKPQTITADYKFKTASMRSLKTKIINRINTDRLVDTKSKNDIIIESNVEFYKLTVNGNVTTTENRCCLPKKNQSLILNYPLSLSALAVNGNINWKSTNESIGRIENVFKNAMKLSDSQTITGSVRFIKDLHVDNMVLKSTINGINLSKIIDDCVLKNKDNQTVLGEIVFTNKVHCAQAKVLKNPTVKAINGQNIARFNETLVRKYTDKIIEGHKHFQGGFHTFNLTTEGGIYGIKLKDLVQVDVKATLPPVVFRNVEIINNLEFEYFNSIPFQKFMSERVLLKHKDRQVFDSDITFENSVYLTGELMTKSLNKLNIEKVVFSKDRNVRTVRGCKTLMQQLHAEGSLNVDRLNDINLKQMYNSSILAGQQIGIEGNLVFEGDITMKNSINATALFVNGLATDFPRSLRNYENISGSTLLNKSLTNPE